MNLVCLLFAWEAYFGSIVKGLNDIMKIYFCNIIVYWFLYVAIVDDNENLFL